MLKSAKVVKRVQVYSMDNPPYRWQPIETLSCYNKPMTAFLSREDCRVCDDTDEAVERHKKLHNLP